MEVGRGGVSYPAASAAVPISGSGSGWGGGLFLLIQHFLLGVFVLDHGFYQSHIHF